MKLSKTQSEAAKGAALLLMFWHHLFGFPERIPAGVNLISVTGGGSLYLEHQLALFGKLCVAVFIFLSGYGLGRKSEVFTFAQAVLRTLGFYLVFWANFAVLMTLAWFFFRQGNGVVVPGWPGFDWGAAGVLKNLLLVSPDYSGEWWFARLFVLILLIAWPCCEWLSRRGTGLLALVSAVLYSLSSYFFQLDHLCSWQACFVVGFVLGRTPDGALGRAFGDLQARLGRGWLYPAATLVLLVFLRKRLGDGMDAFLAPVFVLGMAGVTTRLAWAEKALCLCGRHSASMWLNHTFICYYFLPREFYSLGFTPLLFAALIVASLALSFLTQPLLGLLRLAFGPLLGKPRWD